MSHPSWNESYASGEPLPWDTGTPDPLLVEVIESRAIAPGRTLEVGCGTGTNAIFLAQHGFDVLGIDISEVAVDKARAKAQGQCRFETVDFLAAAPAGGPFEFVFDRGCFHAFDDEGERGRFAENVAAELVEARLVAESDRQHRRRAARGRSAPTKRARCDERDRAVAGNPAAALDGVHCLRGAVEVVALPVAQARDCSRSPQLVADGVRAEEEGR